MIANSYPDAPPAEPNNKDTLSIFRASRRGAIGLFCKVFPCVKRSPEVTRTADRKEREAFGCDPVEE